MAKNTKKHAKKSGSKKPRSKKAKGAGKLSLSAHASKVSAVNAKVKAAKVKAVAAVEGLAKAEVAVAKVASGWDKAAKAAHLKKAKADKKLAAQIKRNETRTVKHGGQRHATAHQKKAKALSKGHGVYEKSVIPIKLLIKRRDTLIDLVKRREALQFAHGGQGGATAFGTKITT